MPADTLPSVNAQLKETVGHSEDLSHHAHATQLSFWDLVKSITAANAASPLLTGALKRIVESIPQFKAMGEHLKNMTALEVRRASLAGAYFGSLVAIHKLQTHMGETMIEANSDWVARLKVVQGILQASGATGASMKATTEAAKALVDYGYDLDANFGRVLTTITMMQEGLGVSAHDAAELAVVMERQVGTSVERVADGMARVVNDTALAASEAARLATNLGRAVATLRPGLGANLGEVTELVGRYEGALKAIGGTPGGFTELLSKMTTQEGMLPAGLIGARSPEFLASEQATKQVLDNFAKYARSFLGNTTGWERALRLHALADQFGVTTQQANLMLKAVEKVNAAQASGITLEERFAEQMRDAGKNIDRLINSLKSFLGQALLPIIERAQPVIKFFADMAAWLSKWKTGVDILTGTIIVLAVTALPFAIIELGLLTKTLWGVAWAARAAAIGAGGRAAGTAAATAGLLQSILGIFTTPIHLPWGAPTAGTGGGAWGAAARTAGGGLNPMMAQLRIVGTAISTAFAPLTAVLASLGLIGLAIVGSITAFTAVTLVVAMKRMRELQKAVELETETRKDANDQIKSFKNKMDVRFYKEAIGGNAASLKQALDVRVAELMAGHMGVGAEGMSIFGTEGKLVKIGGLDRGAAMARVAREYGEVFPSMIAQARFMEQIKVTTGAVTTEQLRRLDAMTEWLELSYKIAKERKDEASTQVKKELEQTREENAKQAAKEALRDARQKPSQRGGGRRPL